LKGSPRSIILGLQIVELSRDDFGTGLKVEQHQYQYEFHVLPP
jgi:hypothetical protein